MGAAGRPCELCPNGTVSLAPTVGGLETCDACPLGTVVRAQALPSATGVFAHCAPSGLQSTVPTEVGRWTTFSNLDLRSSDLRGVLPSELGLLRNLTTLRASSNKLEGKCDQIARFCLVLSSTRPP